MKQSRTEKIKEIFEKIHGDLVPMFRWINYKHMEYWYNEETDEMECDCGVSVKLDYKDEELSYTTVLKTLYDLQDKVIEVYKEKYDIQLYDDY